MKPRLLFISHVNPSNQKSGQQQRVYYSAKAAKEFFHTTLLTLGPLDNLRDASLFELFDDVIILSPTLSSFSHKMFFALPYILFHLRTGLKRSNFALGEIEFTKKHLETITAGKDFDCVILEYWHAYKGISLFQEHGLPCILDMHDVQWKTFELQLKGKKYPTFYKKRIISLYRKNEELAWKTFNRIIAINQIEQKLVKSIVTPSTEVDFLPMGIDLTKWLYLWKQNDNLPSRIGFYGGLSSDVNIKNALYCIDEIMPFIWNKYPTIEFWLIGNNPATILEERAKVDSRIKLTGYVENIQEIISQMQVILCPWEGIFGFRSRIIEVMAVGTPMIVSRDAIAGMGIADNIIKIGQTPSEFAEYALIILNNKKTAEKMSLSGRKFVEQNFSFESTYLNYFENLARFINGRVYE